MLHCVSLQVAHNELLLDAVHESVVGPLMIQSGNPATAGPYFEDLVILCARWPVS